MPAARPLVIALGLALATTLVAGTADAAKKKRSVAAE